MGFSSKYEGTDRIDLGDGYWVEVKKCLSWAESDGAEKAGLNFSMHPNMEDPKRTRTNVIIDPEAKLFEQVLASLVTWNLADDGPPTADHPEGVPDALPWSLEYDETLEVAAKKQSGGQGQKWKSPRRKSLERLFRPAYDVISAHVAKANEPPSRTEAAQFPSSNGSGPAIGEDGAPDNQQVFYGGGLPLEVGDPGGPPPTD